MSFALFLRTLWRRLALSLSPASLTLPGLWDAARLRTEYTDELEAWRNQLLLQTRREALINGVVVTKVEHLKDSADEQWQHEFLRIQVLHEASGERATLVVDRDFWPKDIEGPPEKGKDPEKSEGSERERQTKKTTSTELGTSTKKTHRQSVVGDVQPKDVPEERGRGLVITHTSGEVTYCTDPFFSAHKTVDSVHRGVRDLEKRKSRQILELQTLTFPDCARPSVINVAFFLVAVSGYAPHHHVGEYQGYWFARAACDGLHSEFKGKLKRGRDSDIDRMGRWKNASFKYTNPTRSIAAEYNRQLEQYVTAFNDIRSEAPTRNG